MEIGSITIHPTFVLGIVGFSLMAMVIVYEWRTGKYKQGKKTFADWKIFAWSAAGISLIERPALIATVYFIADALFPQFSGAYAGLEANHLVWCVIAYIAIEEFLHGFAHNFAHKPSPKNPIAAKIHAFYREAHRAHHLVGDQSGRGEVSVTHTLVAGWGWMFFLPNYWFGVGVLYAGLTETWVIANIIKGAWGINVHANWQYDLYLLNHPNVWVRRAMYALAHIFTFPNQHHHHHSRSQNSARNMQTMLSIYDWLCWKTLVIETERPEIYGWKQNDAEQSTIRRYLYRPLKTRSRRATRRAAA